MFTTIYYAWLFLGVPIAAYYVYIRKEPIYVSAKEIKALSTNGLIKRLNMLRRKRLLNSHNFYFRAANIEHKGYDSLNMHVGGLKYLTKQQITQLPNKYQRLLGYEKGTLIKASQRKEFYEARFTTKLTNFLIDSLLYGGTIIFFLIIMFGIFYPGENDIDCSSPGSYGDQVACNRAYERAAKTGNF